jgi:hypothetical protein
MRKPPSEVSILEEYGEWHTCEYILANSTQMRKKNLILNVFPGEQGMVK